MVVCCQSLCSWRRWMDRLQNFWSQACHRANLYLPGRINQSADFVEAECKEHRFVAGTVLWLLSNRRKQALPAAVVARSKLVKSRRYGGIALGIVTTMDADVDVFCNRVEWSLMSGRKPYCSQDTEQWEIEPSIAGSRGALSEEPLRAWSLVTLLLCMVFCRRHAILQGFCRLQVSRWFMRLQSSRQD